jgi:hyperosmotically inducible protein
MKTVIVAVALAVAGPLWAEPEGSSPGPSNPAFQKLDTNRDGSISRDEASRMRGMSKVFDQADANHDGVLDKDEFVRAQSENDRLRVKSFVGDSTITAKVKAALIKDREAPALKVNVKTSQGVVLLSGFVSNEQQAQRAEEIAGAINRRRYRFIARRRKRWTHE